MRRALSRALLWFGVRLVAVAGRCLAAAERLDPGLRAPKAPPAPEPVYVEAVLPPRQVRQTNALLAWHYSQGSGRASA